MAEDPKKILAMSDEELQVWALSGDVGSYVHELGQTAMSMRCSLRAAKAAEETAKHTRRYTLYMLWSVIILALSAFGSLLFEIWRFTAGR